MRLTTLARKIQITPSKLVAFLEQKSIEIDNGINTKLDDDTIALVMEKYAPEDLTENIVQEETQQETTTVNSKVEDQHAEIEEVEDNEEVPSDEVEAQVTIQENSEKEDAQAAGITLPKAGTIDDLEEGFSDEIELIKAKKVKLDGIRVVGKIELPEKPKKQDQKEEVVSENDEQNDEKPRHPHHDKRPKKKAHKARKSGLTISYEEKIRRQEREKRRQLALKKRKEKEIKREHYLKNAQAQSASNSPKKKKKRQASHTHSKQNHVTVHKNPIKRFWAWLNGKYDKF